MLTRAPSTAANDQGISKAEALRRLVEQGLAAKPKRG